MLIVPFFNKFDNTSSLPFFNAFRFAVFHHFINCLAYIFINCVPSHHLIKSRQYLAFYDFDIERKTHEISSNQ